MQGCGTAFFLERVALIVQVREVGEGFKHGPLGVTDLGKHLVGTRVVVGLGMVRLIGIGHPSRSVQTVPGAGTAQAQGNRLEAFAAIDRQVIIVAVSRRRLAVEVALGITGRRAHAPAVVHLGVQAQQYAAGGRGVAAGVVVTTDVVAPPEQLYPAAVVTAVDLRAGVQCLRLLQASVDRFTQVATVGHLRRRHIRVQLPRQLPEPFPRLSGGIRRQQAFVDRAASAQCLGHRRHRSLIAGLRDTGEGGLVAGYRQGQLVRLIVERSANEQVVGGERRKLPLDTLAGAEDSELLAQQAARLGGGQQIGAVLQGHVHHTTVESRHAIALELVALTIGADFDGIHRTRIERDIAGAQRANRMPRGHAPTVVDGQSAHRAVAGQGAAQCGHHAVIGIAHAHGAAIYRHGRGQRAVHRQFATAYPSAARIAVMAFQHQLAIPGLDQATDVGAASEQVLAAGECCLLASMTDVVFELIIGRGIGGQTIEPAFLRFSGGPARLFGSVL